MTIWRLRDWDAIWRKGWKLRIHVRIVRMYKKPLQAIGQEFVIFDDELVKEGSKKWEMSACGYFVGYRMYMQELNYHLYRMWRKFGLKHILNNGNGIFVFKFNNAQGLQSVIESGPWIVNNKPMVVQKRDPSINLDRTEPTRLPVWIKLINIPLEAWTQKGLSALGSRVRKPLIMNAMTTKMCNEGMGSLRYARVLIEANASKGLVDSVKVLYLNKKEKEIKKNQDINEAPDGFVNVKNMKSNDSEQYDKNTEVENEDTEIELDENDVYVVKEGIAKFMTENEVKGECSNLFQ
ncbi:zinc knuckle CX2CX4HX4C containing protein [Tanacetum coccineum]